MFMNLLELFMAKTRVFVVVKQAEGLLAELILSSCYDFVEGCCDVVLKHLSVMQKQRYESWLWLVFFSSPDLI